MSSRAAKEQARKEGILTQFRAISGAGPAESAKFLKQYGYRLDEALDALYNDPNALTAMQGGGAQLGKKLGELFDKYKDTDSSEDEITVEGTMELAKDISLDLEDPILLAFSYILKSPEMGTFKRQDFIEGLKSLNVDASNPLSSLQSSVLPSLHRRLKDEPDFYRSVYLYTFNFAKSAGQRSIPTETAKAFWDMLLPIGQSGKALKSPTHGDDGWKPEYNTWWYEFLEGKKGVSRDTWNMFLDFILSIDSQFAKYDETAAWPSVIDDFVEYARERLKSS